MYVWVILLIMYRFWWTFYMRLRSATGSLHWRRWTMLQRRLVGWFSLSLSLPPSLFLLPSLYHSCSSLFSFCRLSGLFQMRTRSSIETGEYRLWWGSIIFRLTSLRQLIYTVKMNSDCHYVVVISVAKRSDCHYVLPQISLPRSDSHYSFFTVIYSVLIMGGILDI